MRRLMRPTTKGKTMRTEIKTRDEGVRKIRREASKW